MNDDDTRLLAPAPEVVEHEVAYWRAERALDAAMAQHMERILERARQSQDMPTVKPPRAGCLGWLFMLRGR